MFELRSVSKSYGETGVLHGLDLAIPPGKTTVLLGPSGCGKSTTLRMMLALAEPDAGEVLFDGRPVTGGDVRRVRRRVGYVIQDGGLFPHMTARQNVALPATHGGLGRAAARRRIEDLCGLTAFPPDGLDRYPLELSGGQRQRVALMRALVLDPDVLLMDEPLGALDPMIRFELQAELRAIFRKLDKTVVLVTHDLAEAAYFAHRIVLMRDGRIVQAGTVEELTDRPADPFVSRFITAQRGHGVEAVGEVDA